MKIHEYNQMMAYLTRPSYVSGGRVGFKDAGIVNDIALRYNLDDTIKQQLKALYESISNYKKTNDPSVVQKRIDGFAEAFKRITGRLPVANEIASFGAGSVTATSTNKAKYLKEGTNFMEETEAMKKTKRFRPMPYEERVLTLFDEQLRTLPEANISAIAREIFNKDDADSRRAVRNVLEAKRDFKRTPNPKYEGPLTEGQRAKKSRQTKLKKVTDLELEKLIRAREGSGLNLHHMESKRWNVTMGNLSYVDASLNQNVLMDGDAQLEKWYKQRDALADDAIEAHKAINEKGKNFVKQKKFKGYLNFKTYDPTTKKFSDVGMDLSKAIIPEGQLEELRNIPLKELTKDQKNKVVEVAEKVRAGLAKGEPGILKKGIGMLGKGLGRIVMGAIGPTGIVGATAGFGVDPKSAVDRMSIEAEAAFAPELVKSTIGATKGMKNRGAQKVVQQLLNLGMKTPTALRVARIAQPLGLLALGGEGLYKMYKEGHFEKERMMPSLMDKEAYAGAQQEQFDVNQPMFNQGGRVGFAKGPKDPGRRLFIKGVGSAAMIPILGKYFKLAAPATKAAAQYTGPVLEGLGNKLKWVQLLAKRLWNEGDDVTETAATAERQIVKRGMLESGDEVDMVYDVNTKDVHFEVASKGGFDSASGAYEQSYQLGYRAPRVIEEGKQAGKKTKAEVEVAESRPYQVTPEDVELDGDISTVEDAVSDLTELEAFAKKKTVKEIHKKKGTTPKDTNPDWEPPDYDWDDFLD